MATKTFHSSTVAFLDATDSRKLEVYISSNLPTVQIYNSNTGDYIPDWSVTNLDLSADVYLDSEDITEKATIVWYKQGINDVEETELTSTIVSSNVLPSVPSFPVPKGKRKRQMSCVTVLCFFSDCCAA